MKLPLVQMFNDIKKTFYVSRNNNVKPWDITNSNELFRNDGFSSNKS